MNNKKIRTVVYIGILSLLGVCSYVLLVRFTNLPISFSYPWGYTFSILSFNVVGFSLIRSSEMFEQRKIVARNKLLTSALYYAFVAFILFLLNYGLLIIAKALAGDRQPFLFPNDGSIFLTIVWLAELVAFGLLLANRSMRHAIVSERKSAILQEQNDKAKYVALQNQLNPHFLFNTLNTLISEIEYNPENASQFARKLSDVYRYVLQVQQRPLVSLREELEFADSFIFLHQVRLGNNIHYRVNIDDNYIDAELPPLTLQLLIENAIKHNVITKNRPMTIDVHVENQYLVVNNTYDPKPANESTGMGLLNLSTRCSMIFGRDIEYYNTDKIFTVKVPIVYE